MYVAHVLAAERLRRAVRDLDTLRTIRARVPGSWIDALKLAVLEAEMIVVDAELDLEALRPAVRHMRSS